jgi:serine/threonine protein kinase
MVPSVVVEPCVMMRLRDCRVPNVVQIVDCGVDRSGKRVKIRMERLEEIDLDYMRANPRRAVAQLFAAVAGMHKVDVYHGDIKTQNLMVDRHGDIKVIDFSLSSIEEPICNGCCNDYYTISYRAPELLLGCRTTRRASTDVWAAGVTACELILGDLFVVSGGSYEQVLRNNIRFFGLSQTAGIMPLWYKYPKIHEEEGARNERAMLGMIAEAGGGLAADFIRHACDPNVSDRWSAEKLLGHPYICDVVVAAPCEIRQPLSIVLKGCERSYIHRLFERNRDLERELLTEELLRRLGLHEMIDDPMIYTGAMNVTASRLNSAKVPSRFEPDVIAVILSRPETYSFFSKHVFINWEYC